jgi:hypothetical protein
MNKGFFRKETAEIACESLNKTSDDGWTYTMEPAGDFVHIAIRDETGFLVGYME